MPCYHPITAWRGMGKTAKGKDVIVFDASKARMRFNELKLPCGQCIGCRLEYSRQWAIRLMHENTLHPRSAFITLTYNDDNLPFGGTLVKRDWQLFTKRLRKHFSPARIRFFACGEYGATTRRPHYHAIIFNLDFSDKKLYSNRGSNPLYTSDTLSSLWTNGYSSIGSVTPQSTAYVARYILKKRTGDAVDDHYYNVDPRTGEYLPIIPEFTLMSRRPGIARDWYERYSSEVYPADEVIHNGHPVKPPKYYDKLLEAVDPGTFEVIKSDRRRKAVQSADNTPDRLAVREAVAQAKLKQLKREL